MDLINHKNDGTSPEVDLKMDARSVYQLLDKYEIQEMAIMENTSEGHNKVYILLYLKDTSESYYLLRFWGRHDSQLSYKFERVDSEAKAFYDLLEKKLGHGYEAVGNIHQMRYETYVHQIDVTISSIMEDRAPWDRKLGW